MNELPEIKYGPTKVWYASYGSNLCEDRLLCYINGSKPKGATLKHHGMHDKTPPILDLPFSIPNKLYFADYSTMWKGGVAFISPKESLEEKTLCRIYLIDRQQFIELFAQENNIPIDKVKINFDKLNSKKQIKSGNGGYNLLIKVGHKLGRPIYTFTRSDDDPSVHTCPSESYLKVIIRGLIECWSKENDALIEYLNTATKKSYSTKQLTDMFKECEKEYIRAHRTDNNLFRVEPTKDRKGNQREFIAQLSRKNKELLGAELPDTLSLAVTHNDREYNVIAMLNNASQEPADHVIRIDQKLRTAIGVQIGEWVRVKKASGIKSTRIHTFFERLIGTQSELMRVYKATYEDMEIPVCRMLPSTFEIIGVTPGSFVYVQSTKRATRVRGLALSMYAWDQRINMIELEPSYHSNPRQTLHLDRLIGGSVGDLPPIFIDLDLRNELGVDVCDCVRVTRDVQDSFLSKLYLFVLPLSFTFIAGAIASEHNSFLRFGCVVIVILISMFALCIEVRNKIR